MDTPQNIYQSIGTIIKQQLIELYDNWFGIDSLQHKYNGGFMPGFNFVPFLV